jgi:hypothetical protein
MADSSGGFMPPAYLLWLPRAIHPQVSAELRVASRRVLALAARQQRVHRRTPSPHDPRARPPRSHPESPVPVATPRRWQVRGEFYARCLAAEGFNGSSPAPAGRCLISSDSGSQGGSVVSPQPRARSAEKMIPRAGGLTLPRRRRRWFLQRLGAVGAAAALVRGPPPRGAGPRPRVPGITMSLSPLVESHRLHAILM